MKKCRYMSKKIIVPIFSLMLVVSAFFYASMDVSASGVNSSFSDSVSITKSFNSYYNTYFNLDSDEFDMVSGLDPDLYYRVNYSLSGEFVPDRYLNFYNVSLRYGDFTLGFYENIMGDNGAPIDRPFNTSSYVVGKGSQFVDSFLSCYCWTLTNTNSSITVRWDFDLIVDSVEVIDSASSDDYQSGYNAGYAAGLSQGESSGYSSGYDAGYTEGESVGYDSGFQAGVDSVDTQSYYDAGYEAGYTSGYSEGYDSGYDEGYADAMDKVAGWGADDTVYPVQVAKRVAVYNGYVTSSELTFVPDTYDMYLGDGLTVIDDIDPTHVFCLSGSLNNFQLSANGGSSYSSYSLVAEVGGRECVIGRYRTNDLISKTFKFFIPGDLISDVANLKCVVSGAVGTDSAYEPYLSIVIDSWDLYLYDYGPSGNTQNHIANQTDQLTNGYDSSVGDSTSSVFSDGVSEYEEVEGSLFTSAKSGLADYQFFDLESEPSVLTGISFVTSIMTGIFNSMGGLTGAGIVLSVLFSVMLVSIVAGLYRYFVYSGKGGKHDRKGGNG